MAFPIKPDVRFNQPETLFLIQDPFRLRRSITPVFVSYQESGVVKGCGTSFFVTPFGKQLSAMHIVTDFFNERGIPVRPNDTAQFQYMDARIEILFDPGLVYGTRPAGKILYASKFVMFPIDQTEHPLAFTRSAEELGRCEPSLDLISWDLGDFSNLKSEYLPLRLGQGPHVKVGDRVMAIGFPQNSGGRRPGRTMSTYHEEMFGSVGTITEVSREFDQTRNRWPTITVDTYWPPGMSGGPVFSEMGEVIGIVSRGGETWSHALWLQALPYREDIFGPLDPTKPGWVKGWGVCNGHSLIESFQTEEAALERAAQLGEDVTVQFCSSPYLVQRFNDRG